MLQVKSLLYRKVTYGRALSKNSGDDRQNVGKKIQKDEGQPPSTPHEALCTCCILWVRYSTSS